MRVDSIPLQIITTGTVMSTFDYLITYVSRRKET